MVKKKDGKEKRKKGLVADGAARLRALAIIPKRSEKLKT